MTVLDFAGPSAPARFGIALVQVHDALWRITRPAGDVLGYIERIATSEGARFRAKRYIASRRSYVAVGEFWGFDDAIGCFRTN